MAERHRTSHDIAVECATRMVKAADAADLPWQDTAVSCETVIAIVVSAVIHLAGRSDDVRFAAELIDTMTEAAHKRVAALIRGVPYNG